MKKTKKIAKGIVVGLMLFTVLSRTIPRLPPVEMLAEDVTTTQLS